MYYDPECQAVVAWKTCSAARVNMNKSYEPSSVKTTHVSTADSQRSRLMRVGTHETLSDKDKRVQHQLKLNLFFSKWNDNRDVCCLFWGSGEINVSRHFQMFVHQGRKLGSQGSQGSQRTLRTQTSFGKDHKVRKENCQLCRRWLRQDAATSFAQTLERHRSQASQGSQGTLRTQGSHSKL